jgi:hypothetical protein
MLLESARKLITADPEWFVAVGLPSSVVNKWTQTEATTLLRGFKCRPMERLHWVSARFWFAAAFRSVDLKSFLVEARLKEMIELAPQASFLGNDDTMQLVRALGAKKKFLSLVKQFVDAALQSDWREWVRPELEKFRLELGT